MSTPKSSDRLRAIREKLHRAQAHLYALDDAIETYLSEEPCRPVIEVHPNHPGRFIPIIRERIKPPLLLSILLGDCLHNLRSALDHLAWQLVEAAGNTPRTDPPRTQFPIRDRCLDSAGNAIIVDVPGGIDVGARTFLHGIQPCNRPNPAEHPLAVIRDLSNIDKHRILNFTAVASRETEIRLRDPNSGTTFGHIRRLEALYDDAPIGVWELPPGTVLKADTEVEVEGEMFVALKESRTGSWRDKPVTYLVDELLKYVWEPIITGFEPFLN